MNDMNIPIDNEKKWFTFYKYDGTKDTQLMTHAKALAKYRDDRMTTIMFIDVDVTNRYTWDGERWIPTDEMEEE